MEIQFVSYVQHNRAKLFFNADVQTCTIDKNYALLLELQIPVPTHAHYTHRNTYIYIYVKLCNLQPINKLTNTPLVCAEGTLKH